MPADPIAESLGQMTSRLDSAALLDQQGRLLKADTTLPALALIPERMVMIDAVDAPFELRLDCLSTSVQFELSWRPFSKSPKREAWPTPSKAWYPAMSVAPWPRVRCEH